MKKGTRLLRHHIKSMNARDIQQLKQKEDEEYRLKQKVELDNNNFHNQTNNYNNEASYDHKSSHTQLNKEDTQLNYSYVSHHLKDLFTLSYLPSLLVLVGAIINLILNFFLPEKYDLEKYRLIASFGDLIFIAVILFVNKFISPEKFWSDKANYQYSELNFMYYNLSRLLQGIVSAWSTNILKKSNIIFNFSSIGLILSSLIYLFTNASFYLPFILIYLFYVILKMANQAINQKLFKEKYLLIALTFIVLIGEIISPFELNQMDFIGLAFVILLNNIFIFEQHIEIYYPKLDN